MRGDIKENRIFQFSVWINDTKILRRMSKLNEQIRLKGIANISSNQVSIEENKTETISL